jgi:excisionase family DNA binding protein
VDRRLVTTEEAAEYLGVSRWTLARWRVEGSGPRYVKVGGPVRYDVADLAAWVDERRRQSTREQGTAA